MASNTTIRYRTAGGIHIRRQSQEVPYAAACDGLLAELDSQRGVLLSSSYEYPGRYRRWELGFVRPPLAMEARDEGLRIEALNARGRVLLPPLEDLLRYNAVVARLAREDGCLVIGLKPPADVLYEEQRSRRSPLFGLLRALISLFHAKEDSQLGLYGAFGYDLVFQFEELRRRLPRGDARQLVLYLPDELLLVDHQKESAVRLRYEFEVDGQSTEGLPREGRAQPFRPASEPLELRCDHRPGEYADIVRRALDYFRQGELFEAVPGQLFRTACRDAPSAVFARLRRRNPAPYGALLNLGDAEYLVAASPEMYLRVENGRVESCPISGTIARGKTPLEDARQIRTLLNSEKDLAELSMCTDVDRNDKARVCVAESIRVLGRRQIELYSRLIHTVDHVEGQLKPGFDALDAFLSHAWAVTVTGAPKPAAMQFVEDHEKSPRGWYGGALGCLAFNGDMNTGLTLRTIRIAEGVAEIRAGATLLADSVPEDEEAETRLKASALLDALQRPDTPLPESATSAVGTARAQRPRVLLIDHRDSFVHNLSAYCQAAGAEVATVRSERAEALLRGGDYDLVLLSPGPGRPADFGLHRTIDLALAQRLPILGICLGLQGLVEYFGGSLRLLDVPVHGKSSRIRCQESRLFAGLPRVLEVGRYHSLAARQVPDCLRVTAESEDGVVMAIEHRHLPVLALQFHPESILSMEGEAGMRIVRNALHSLSGREEARQHHSLVKDAGLVGGALV